MSPPEMSEGDEVTLLLSALTRGDDGAASKLIPVVYGELRKLAGRLCAKEVAAPAPEATADEGLGCRMSVNSARSAPRASLTSSNPMKPTATSPS